jgi:2-polyprenyl-6-methoxyphenol hydroxylase-like FAD-dependent oxidoreductase
VIVGAGPTGASLALLLARQGLPVVLVEASREPSRRFRGEALMPHGLAALAAMGLWPLPATIPQKPLVGWRFVVDRLELFRLDEPLESPSSQGCTLISQPAFLRHLVDQLEALPWATVLLGRRVQGLEWRGERVAGVRLADGSLLESALVVAADGRSSLLRQQAQLQLKQQGNPFDLLWFQLQSPEPSPLGGLFTTMVGPEGLCSVFEAAEGSLQIGWVRPTSGGDGTPQDWLERLVAQSPADLAPWWRQQGSGLGQPTPLRVEVGHVESWWRPGLLLLGDAAHPMSPVRAQGINLALRDAWTAAQELIPLLQAAPHQAQPPLEPALARIEARRRGEVTSLQNQQAQETRRGQLLLEQPGLRQLLGRGGPWIGGLVARRWRHDQRQLRQGVTNLTPEASRPGNDG